jgi:glycosyltransferase involved in cell wall biosynthesis
MKKVCYVITRADEIGGAHIHVRDMAKYLRERGISSSIVVGGSGVFTQILEQEKINYHVVPSLVRQLSPLNDIKSLFHLNRILRLSGADLISVHSAKVGVLVRLLSLLPGFPPVIFTAHGWSFADGVPILRKTIYLQIERLLALTRCPIITVCEADARLALSLAVSFSSNITVIHNGMPPLSSDASYQHDMPRTCVSIVTVARFEPQKDYRTLLNALCLIADLDWSLTCIGGGSELESIMQMSRSLGISCRIKFIGRSSNVDHYLHAADIFVLSSFWEGFPRSIVEALRASLPVVATNVGGVSESVIDSFNGYCVPPCDPRSLSDRLRKLILNPRLRRRMGDRGRDLYISKFTFDNMASRTLELYRSTLKAYTVQS